MSILTPGTIHTGDNLPILKSMPSGTIDLVYLDPPFNSGQEYHGREGTSAAGAKFKDNWTASDINTSYAEMLHAFSPALDNLIGVMGDIYGQGTQAYCQYIAVRLIELRRILKDTGSIYLHCDTTMSHPLKLILDCIFGKSNFLNDITWSYRRWTVRCKKYQRMHDSLLFYSKSAARSRPWNQPYVPLAPSTFQMGKGNAQKIVYVNGKRTQVVSDKKSPGAAMPDVWVMSYLNSQSKERTGYPTQKPLTLLRRIIEASSNPGDLILDPFCGSGTALVAAEELGRQWIGIDACEYSVIIIEERLSKCVRQQQGEPLPVKPSITSSLI